MAENSSRSPSKKGSRAKGPEGNDYPDIIEEPIRVISDKDKAKAKSKGSKSQKQSRKRPGKKKTS